MSSELNKKLYVASTVSTLETGNEEVLLCYNNFQYFVELKVNSHVIFEMLVFMIFPLLQWMITEKWTVLEDAILSCLTKSEKRHDLYQLEFKHMEEELLQ